MEQIGYSGADAVGTVPSPALTEQSRWVNRGVWTLQILLALVYLGAGTAKLVGVDSMVEEFQKIGIGQWFRYVTGTIEMVGAVSLLIPRLSGLGAMILAATMVGAIFTHLFVFANSPLAPLILLVLVATVIWARRGTFKDML